jgi:hypothetical protein
MGSTLTRVWLGFRRLVLREEIVNLKLKTNQIEDTFKVSGRRVANLDPGYLTIGKVVLASTKDHQHRLYLGKGIYGEVTLRYSRGSYIPWEWTYPDYRRREASQFFMSLKKKYRKIVRQNEEA